MAKQIMRETVKQNADRNNKKIIEIYNQKLEEEGLEQKKINTTNVSQMKKDKNLVAQKKHQ